MREPEAPSAIHDRSRPWDFETYLLTFNIEEHKKLHKHHGWHPECSRDIADYFDIGQSFVTNEWWNERGSAFRVRFFKTEAGRGGEEFVQEGPCPDVSLSKVLDDWRSRESQ